MTKENITRFIRPCKSCKEPTDSYDGYCDTCGEWDHESNSPSVEPNEDLMSKFQKGELAL